MIKNVVCVAVLLAAGAACRAENVVAARACVALTDKEARLACFDAAYAAPAPGVHAAAAAAAAAPAKAAAAAPATDVERFGDEGQLPAEKAVQAKVPKTLTVGVLTASPRAGGLYRLTLVNGQVWDTHLGDRAVDFKSGDTITIQRSLGGYQIGQAGSGRSVGAKRVQ